MKKFALAFGAMVLAAAPAWGSTEEDPWKARLKEVFAADTPIEEKVRRLLAFAETTWDVDGEGIWWMGPNPWLEVSEPKSRFRVGGFRIFSPEERGGADDAEGWFPASFSLAYRTGWAGLGGQVFSGGSDLASLSDAETHFEKLGLGAKDAEVVKKADSAVAAGLEPRQAGRAALDRLLAVRLCGTRGLREAEGPLKRIAQDAKADRLLRDAATASLARIRKEPPPDLAAGLPPLEDRLRLLPGDYEILVAVQPHRSPAWKNAGRAVRGIEFCSMAAQILNSEGGPSPVQLEATAVFSEIHGDMNFEAARQLGNLRIDRAVMTLKAVGSWEEAGTLHGVVDGVFPLPTLLEHPEIKGSKPEEREGFKVFRVAGPRIEVGLSEKAILVAPKVDPAPREPKSSLAGKWDELRELGLGGNDALWVHVRNVEKLVAWPEKGPLSSLRPARSAVVRVACPEKGLELSLDLDLGSEAAAAEGAKAMEDLRGALFEDVDAGLLKRDNALARLIAAIQDSKASAHGPVLRLRLALAGMTPESLLEAAGTYEMRFGAKFSEEREMLADLGRGFTRAAAGEEAGRRARISARRDQKVIENLRRLVVSEEQYRGTDGAGRYTDLSGLGQAKPPFIEADLADGEEMGYRFSLDFDGGKSFTATAVPTRPGVTGNRSFFVDDTGVVRASDRGPATLKSPPVE